MYRTRVAVVESHVLQRTYAVKLLQTDRRLQVVLACEALPDLMQALTVAPHRFSPDLVLLDLLPEGRPQADPLTVRQLVDGGIDVLIFSALSSPALIRQMLKAGAKGVISKREREADVLAAIHAVLDGKAWVSPHLTALLEQAPVRPRLSRQEERTLTLYASGRSIEEVATTIGVRPDTVKKYLQRIRTKYAQVGRPMRSRVELSHLAIADGYLAVPDAWTADARPSETLDRRPAALAPAV